MGLEIERKFLVKKDFPYLEGLYTTGSKVSRADIEQAYFKNGRIRVRVVNKSSGGKAFLTIKSEREGMSRHEFEYEIPIDDAFLMMEIFCGDIVKKTRYCYQEEKQVWEVDVFKGENEGLVLAEIELSSEDEEFVLPYFIDREVTNDNKYYNSKLAKHPYTKWKRLYTSYFANKFIDYKDCVSIAGTSPKYFSGRKYKQLAPKYWFFSKYKNDGDKNFYKNKYYEEVLVKLDPEEVYNDLGQNSILLCWEKPEDFCHRHIVAKWLSNTIGVDIKEID